MLAAFRNNGAAKLLCREKLHLNSSVAGFLLCLYVLHSVLPLVGFLTCGVFVFNAIVVATE